MLPILLATMLLTTTPTAPRDEPGAVVMTTPPELPCRLGFPKLIARQVRELWAYSPTFRQQCLKIGDAGAMSRSASRHCASTQRARCRRSGGPRAASCTHR